MKIALVVERLPFMRSLLLKRRKTLEFMRLRKIAFRELAGILCSWGWDGNVRREGHSPLGKRALPNPDFPGLSYFG